MVQIVTVYPGTDGGSRLADVSIDQFSEIIKHIGEGPNRLNQGPPLLDPITTPPPVFNRLCSWKESPRLKLPMACPNNCTQEIPWSLRTPLDTGTSPGESETRSEFR